MFLRRTTVTSHGRKYEYVHLVESVRRESDGRPVHRILANLGALDDRAFDNLKAALDASRAGKRVALVTAAKGHRPAKPQANLRYLDIAVACELWRQWDLARLLRDAMPNGDSAVPTSLIVEALVAQRLVAPDSKLAAVRWFPNTALPELLGIAPSQFNNTRLHRALDDLEATTPSLMAKLPRLYQQRDGVFASLFLDVTDTWFVGHGPDLAARAKTKEGLIERKIGIVLLCNERGYPLRWEVIAGNCNDGVAMTNMLQAVSGLEWIGDAPVVVDRAMGHSAHVRAMADTKLRFLTALTRTEVATYAPELPWASMEGLSVEGTDSSEVAAEAARRAVAAGMQKIDNTLFVLDVGVVEPAAIDDDEPAAPKDEEPNVRAMRLCRQARQAVLDGRHGSHAAAAAALGLSKALLDKYCTLLKLPEEIQCAILDGRAASRPLVDLLRIARLDDPQAQRSAFDALVGSTPPKRAARRPRGPRASAGAAEAQAQAEPLRVRVVAYFNPQRFAEKRRAAFDRLQRIREFVAALNNKLAGPRARRSRDKILADIDRRLRRDDLLELFAVTVEEKDLDGRRRYHVELTLDPDDWRQRRRYDGFTVLVGHQNLPHSAAQLALLYRAKDMVEKDFQVIKSVVELRPVRHHTDIKVRAHVTLCMLALLLERTLRDQLAGKYTVEQALEMLEPCRLNRYRTENGPGVYTITETDQQQRSLLRKLRLLHLADDDHLAARISLR